MAEEMEFGEDILTLVDEEGVEHQFEVVDTMEVADSRFMALVPVFDDSQELLDDDGELVVLQVVTHDDEDYLEPIEDEALFDRIAGIFMERLEDEFDFETPDEE